MREGRKWLAMGAVCLSLGGCCNNPGVFQKLDQSLRLAQAYYEPLLQQDLKDDRVRRAIVAADTTLLLAAELQAMWCPSGQSVEQLEMQMREARRLAQEAGVKEAGQGTGK